MGICECIVGSIGILAIAYIYGKLIDLIKDV